MHMTPSMERDEESVPFETKIDVVLLGVKIIFAVTLLVFGIQVVNWVIDIVQLVLTKPEGVALVNKFATLQDGKQILEISINHDPVLIKSENVFRWLLLTIIFMVLFNVIGRAISGIFTSFTSIVTNLRLKKPGDGY
mgnify:FL=1|jgi:hypothetical protein